MLVYSIIMFATAALFLVMSTLIYRGRTELIHSYHQTKVTDQAGYAKAFGKALSVIGIALLLSGVISLLGDGEVIVLVAVAVLLLGLGAGFGCILWVQRKYNKGLF